MSKAMSLASGPPRAGTYRGRAICPALPRLYPELQEGFSLSPQAPHGHTLPACPDPLDPTECTFSSLTPRLVRGEYSSGAYFPGSPTDCCPAPAASPVLPLAPHSCVSSQDPHLEQCVSLPPSSSSLGGGLSTPAIPPSGS